MVVYAFVTVVYPLCGSYTVYLANSALAGAVISYINSIPSIWIVEIFQEKAKTYVQILHFFFPIGEFAGPVLVSPFLRNDLKNETSPTNSFNHTSLNLTSTVLPLNQTLNSTSTYITDTEYDVFDFYGLFDVAKHSQLW